MAVLEKVKCTTVTSVSEEHAFFSTLLVLGFNVTANETQYKISFKPDMFRVPCKKGVEVIIHFLLTQLDHDRAKIEFSMCWPAWDAKKEHQYRKCVFNWLTELHRDKDEGIIVPRINTSTLTRASGAALITLLERLGALVLQSKIKGIDHVEAAKFSPIYNPSHPHMAKAAAEALYLELETTKKKIVDVAQVRLLLKEEWDSNAKNIKDNIQRLSKEKKALELRIADLDSRQHVHLTLGDTKYKKTLSLEEEEQLKVETQYKASQLRSYVKKIYEVCSRQTQERAVVNSILSGACNAHSIDAEQIPLQVPSVIIPHYQKRLAEGQIGNTYKSGKVDLVALTQLSNMSLKLMLEELEKGCSSTMPNQSTLPVLSSTLPSLCSSLQTHDSSLTELNHSLETLAQQSAQFKALLNNTVNQSLTTAAEELKLSSPMPQYTVPAHPTPSSATLLITPETPGPSREAKHHAGQSPLSRHCVALYDKGKSLTVHRSRESSSESKPESRCPLAPIKYNNVIQNNIFESPIAGAKVRVVQKEKLLIEDLENSSPYEELQLENSHEESSKQFGFGSGVEKIPRTPPSNNGSQHTIEAVSPPRSVEAVSPPRLEDSCNLINNLSCDLSLLSASLDGENMSILTER